MKQREPIDRLAEVVWVPLVQRVPPPVSVPYPEFIE